MPRKRNRDEMEASEAPAGSSESIPLITKIRNTWEFSSTMQFIHTFGRAVRIDDNFDIEDFEEECLKPTPSEKLEEIGLALLKWISSFRGLDLSNWDEYTRRQYEAKAPKLNPYGSDEAPKHFRDFDIFLKIRVLHQLTIWTFWNPDRMRERMPDHNNEARMIEWRVEEFGWDSEDRTYYLLDDDRLYRRTEPPLPALPKAKPKATSQKAQAAKRRASKRARIEKPATPEVDEEEDADVDVVQPPQQEDTGTPSGPDADTLGGYKWECVAITLPEYQSLVDSMRRTKDANEKALRDRLMSEVVPIIEAREERQRRKIERRERELLAMEKMATAKRSSRIAGKQEREKVEREQEEVERKHAADLAAAHRQQEKMEQIQDERRSRMMTREQRIKDREYKRLLAEEELAKIEAQEEAIANGESRGSERQARERLARKKEKVDALKEIEEEWTFDCSGCGVHGKNIDDGSHSLSCERCSIWQHSKCLKISEEAAEREDFHFICRDCRRKEEDAKRPKISLKFRTAQSSSPPQPTTAPAAASPRKSSFVGVEVPGYPQNPPSQTNGYQQSSQTYGPRPPSAGQSGHATQAYSPNPAMQRQYPYNISPYQQHNAPVMQTNSPAYPPLQPGQQWGYPPPPHQYPVHRPGSSGQPYAASHPNNTSNFGYPAGYTASQSPTYSTATPAARPPSLGGGSRPNSSHGQLNGTAARLPSPVVNRPTMSPTTGNFDVGPIAGISPFGRPEQRTPSFSNGTPAPRQQSQSSSPPLSGLSPSKNPTPRAPQATPQHQPSQSHASQPISNLPPPSSVPVKASSTPVHNGQRSVSGTPLFPPAEKLAPAPEHSHSKPVPTPSKHEVPQPFSAMSSPAPAAISQGIVGTPAPNGVINGSQVHAAPKPQQSSALPSDQTVP